jgi:ligand-binding sensor domain-containing protein
LISTHSTIYEFNKDTGAFIILGSFDNLKLAYEDSKGYIWIIVLGGVYRLNTQTGELPEYYNTRSISVIKAYKIFDDSNKNLILCTDCGLF